MCVPGFVGGCVGRFCGLNFLEIRKMKNLCATLVTGLVLSFAGTALAQTGAAPSTPKTDGAKVAEKAKEAVKGAKAGDVKVGDKAPDFTITDTDGKSHNLAELNKSGKIVVLQWFNSECPYVVKHYGDAGNTFNDIQKNYASKGVVLIAVNSGGKGKAGTGKELNQKVKETWKMAYPIVLDESGEIGRAYGAKNTPAMYIVNKDGIVAYTGAIDDDKGSEKPGKTNYVTKALDQLIAGETVTTSETKPYGCGVKYGS